MDITLKQLIELQTLDSQLRKVEEELLALPKELSGRESELKKAKEAVQAAKDGVKKGHSEANQAENEIKSREEKISKLDGEANRVRDNAQLMAIQHQIQTIRQEISQFEDTALAQFSKIESLEVEGKKAQAELAQIEAEMSKFRQSIESEVASAKKRKSELLATREKLVPDVKPEIYTIYNRILGAREGQAIVAVEGQTCQGCNMEVVTNDYAKLLSGKQIVQCRHCNRILFIAAEKESSEGA